jgi:ABC-type transport system substrate-binding protein/DNA-binding SARP family transcriptional activator/DNA-binding beta-propeller fold protein YncE
VPIALGGRRQKAVLAVLLLHANEFVSADRLVEEAWSGRPPPGAAGTLQTYISRLRRVLADTGASLTTLGEGYELRIDPADFDVTCFRRLVAEGRIALAAGNPQGACELLESALSLWQGRPLADLADEDFAVEAIRDLEHERLAAEIDRVDAGLELGWADVAFIRDIHRLVDRYPHDERIRERLMLALYRSGRQAEALEAYRDTRMMLLNDFGIDPSERLRALERAILRQDPTLDAPSSGGSVDLRPRQGEGPAPMAPARGRRRGRKRLVGLAAATALVAAAVTAGIAFTSSGRHGTWSRCCSEAAVLGLGNGSVQAGMRVNLAPTAMAVDGNTLWVASSPTGVVDHIDVAHHRLTRIAFNGSPSGLAVTPGVVWVADSSGRDLGRISTADQQIVDRIDVCNGPHDVTAGLGYVWATCPLDGTLVQLDPRTDAVRRRIPLGGSPMCLAVGAGSVWVTLEASGVVARYDPRSRSVTRIAVGSGPSAIAASAGAIWVANSLDHSVSRISADSGSVSDVIQMGAEPDSLAAAPDGVWVAEPQARKLVLLAGSPTRVARVVYAPSGLAAIASRRHVLAAAAGVPLSRRRGGTVRYSDVPKLLARPDPAISYSTDAWEILAVTNDGLVGFRRTGGSAGETLVPDLAEALPQPGDRGRTWTFHLRPGIDYSTGRPVEARDVRYALERDFQAGFPTAPLYDDVRGAGHCHIGEPCNLAHGIVVHGRTITFRLTHPDGDFLDKLALPFADAVPAGWRLPSNRIGVSGVVPATGPYKMAAYSPRRVVLVRNPRFHEWSPVAQPAGLPDRVVASFFENRHELIQQITGGRTDIAGVEGRSMVERVTARYPGQLVDTAIPAIAWEAVNTRRPPFNDVRVRRAFAYALNRAAAARDQPGSRPSCQILPPTFPGYSPFCPYTLAPGRTWSHVDLRYARQLVAAAGARGETATFVVEPGLVNDVASIRTALRQIGLRVHVVTVSSLSALVDDVVRSPAPYSLTAYGWAADYPAPSDFFDEIFTCRSFVPRSAENRNLSEFCSHRIDRMIHRAEAVQVRSPSRAGVLWAKVDEAVTKQAAVIPLYSSGVMDWVSHGVRDFSFNPILGSLLGQVWRARPSR